MGALYQQHRIERVLVVAPTSVCSVWPHDLQQFAAFPYHCETLLGEKKKRLEGLDALEVWPFASLKIAVINYESTHRDDFYPRPPRGGRQQKQRQNLYFLINYTTFCTNLEEP